MEKEIETKEILNWQRLAVTVGIVLVTAAVVGGTVWYLMDQNAQSIADSNKKSTSVLEKQVSELKGSSTTTAAPTTDQTAGWKNYTDSTFGFTFKYPANLAIANEANIKTTNTISVKTEKITEISENLPLGLDRATALQDKVSIANGDPSIGINGGDKNAFKLLTIVGATGKSSVVTSLIDVCNISLRRTAYIYRNDYRIVVTYNYYLPDLESGNPSYFDVNDGCVGKVWADSQGSSFVTDLLAGKTDKKTQDWYTEFDRTIKSLTFS
jgi:hypothetical protein